MQAGSVISHSPSFNSYSNNTILEIAARVVNEFDSEEFYHDSYFETNSDYLEKETKTNFNFHEADDNEEDSEFEFVTTEILDQLPAPISADLIFLNGQIRPVYTVFNRDLLLRRVEIPNEDDVFSHGRPRTIRLPLRKLFSQEREITEMSTSPSSSEESDELNGVPEETYCVWMPKEAEGRPKRFSSAGSNSKRWKFKNMLQR